MNRMLVVSTGTNSWCGMLAAALGRHVGHGPLEDLEQRLLHALAGDVPGDRRVLALACDLVHLVDVDDAALALLDIVAGGLQQLEDDVLDVLARRSPASVSVVASTMAKGTDSSRARVWASRVLPEPVGPTSRMFDFCSSTSLRRREAISLRL